MHRSGYMLAAFDALGKITDRFMQGMRGRWNDNFTRKQMSNFFSNTCSGYMYSYGEDFPNRKKFDKYNAGRYRIYRKMKETRLFDEAIFVADSGGFQISNGRLTRRESDIMIPLYHEFLEEYHDILHYAFVLDVPPGPGCRVFETFDDVYEMNLDTYMRARNLPDEIRRKMIYVHHFRTPQLWEIYNRILRENDMFEAFDYFSTGGLVANLSTDLSTPCIIFTLPLIPLITEAKRFGKTEIKFHVLGGGNFRDILFMELFKRVIFDYHGIKMHVTYDSTAPFKQNMQARYLHVENDLGQIIKMYFRSFELKKRFYGGVNVEDQIQIACNHIADILGIKRISTDGVYDDNTGTLHEDVKLYTMLFSLHQFSEEELVIRKFVDHLYPLYKEGLLSDFYNECYPIMIKYNQGRSTKKQRVKTQSIVNSLDMLKNLDEDYAHHIVDKFLAKDEFCELDQGRRVCTL
jgi:hypothetical protein